MLVASCFAGMNGVIMASEDALIPRAKGEGFADTGIDAMLNG
jgi:hypothetical protein